MEDVLHSLFKFSLFVSLPYAMGVAARAWWEFRFILGLTFGCVVLWLFLSASVFGQDLAIRQDIQNIMSCTLLFTPVGYLSGLPIIKYLDARVESFLASDEFHDAYYKNAERPKPTFSREDMDAFHDYMRDQQTQTRARSRGFSGMGADMGADMGSGRFSGSSYERYSQHRRAQPRAEESAQPPLQQDDISDKDKMFNILEVTDRNASAKQIKSAYRKLAWKYHPDVLAKNELSDSDLDAAGARMQDINHAYDWLKENGFAE